MFFTQRQKSKDISQSTKRIKTEHWCSFKKTISESNLSFPSLEKLQAHIKFENHPLKSKEYQMNQKKVKYTTISS